MNKHANACRTIARFLGGYYQVWIDPCCGVVASDDIPF